MITVFIPDAFIKILGYAGMILVMIAVLLPIYLYFKANIEKPYIKIIDKYALILCLNIMFSYWYFNDYFVFDLLKF